MFQRLPLTGKNPLLGFALHVQLHIAVNPKDPFMVPFMPITTNAMETLPKALTRTLGNDGIQGINHRRISLSPICRGFV